MKFPRITFSKSLFKNILPAPMLTTSEEHTQESPETGLPEPKYHTLKTISYGDFLRVILDNEISRLIVSGFVTADVLLGYLNILLQEYSDLIKTEKSDSVFTAYKKLIHTEWKINFISNALEYLKYKYDSRIAEKICEQGYDMIVDCEDREQYFKQIYSVETEAKFLIVLLNQHNAEYMLLCPKGSGETKRDHMSYQKEIAMLSKFMGYRINKDEISAYEFCSIVNLYIESNKRKVNNGTTI
jgi:hypothetical protein